MPLRLFASVQRSGAYLTRPIYLGAMTGFFSTTRGNRTGTNWRLGTTFLASVVTRWRERKSPVR
jgi:hypothetical protein